MTRARKVREAAWEAPPCGIIAAACKVANASGLPQTVSRSTFPGEPPWWSWRADPDGPSGPHVVRDGIGAPTGEVREARVTVLPGRYFVR